MLYLVHPKGRSGHDRKVVGFTITYAISFYHHWSCELESRSWRGVLDTTLCGKVCQWLPTGLWFSTDTLVSSNKSNLHDITEILLKVALNTTILTIFRAIITQDKQFGIPLTPPHFGVCPKPGPGLPPSHVMVFAMFNELRWEVIVGIVWIVDYHCLHFLFIIQVSIITGLPYIS